jgi:hypothetical protein
MRNVICSNMMKPHFWAPDVELRSAIKQVAQERLLYWWEN